MTRQEASTFIDWCPCESQQVRNKLTVEERGPVFLSKLQDASLTFYIQVYFSKSQKFDPQRKFHNFEHICFSTKTSVQLKNKNSQVVKYFYLKK